MALCPIYVDAWGVRGGVGWVWRYAFHMLDLFLPRLKLSLFRSIINLILALCVFVCACMYCCVLCASVYVCLRSFVNV
jgi:hypothetical protein